jgi:hypothetical protein
VLKAGGVLFFIETSLAEVEERRQAMRQCGFLTAAAGSCPEDKGAGIFPAGATYVVLAKKPVSSSSSSLKEGGVGDGERERERGSARDCSVIRDATHKTLASLASIEQETAPALQTGQWQQIFGFFVVFTWLVYVTVLLLTIRYVFCYTIVLPFFLSCLWFSLSLS